MSDLKVSGLTVDLLQNQGTIALFRSIPGVQLGQPPRITAVNITVPISGAGDRPDAQLKGTAIEEARKTLEEAIRALDNFTVP